MQLRSSCSVRSCCGGRRALDDTTGHAGHHGQTEGGDPRPVPRARRRPQGFGHRPGAARQRHRRHRRAEPARRDLRGPRRPADPDLRRQRRLAWNAGRTTDGRCREPVLQPITRRPGSRRRDPQHHRHSHPLRRTRWLPGHPRATAHRGRDPSTIRSASAISTILQRQIDVSDVEATVGDVFTDAR